MSSILRFDGLTSSSPGTSMPNSSGNKVSRRDEREEDGRKRKRDDEWASLGLGVGEHQGIRATSKPWEHILRDRLGHRAQEGHRSKVEGPGLKDLTSEVFPTQKLQGRGHKCSLAGHRAIQVRRRALRTKVAETLAPEDIRWVHTTGELPLKAPRVIQDHHIITHSRRWQCRLWPIGEQTTPRVHNYKLNNPSF